MFPTTLRPSFFQAAAVSPLCPWSDPFRDPAKRRAWRVTRLIGLIAVCGLADLALTFSLMSTTGMMEANPLARLAAAGGPAALVAGKLLTIAVNALILFRLRRTITGELGAWLCAAFMLVLISHWANVGLFMLEHGTPALASLLQNDAQWVRFQ